MLTHSLARTAETRLRTLLALLAGTVGCNSCEPLPTELLTVMGSGTGDGTVRSTPSGIDCTIVAGTASGDCEAAYPAGTEVRLIASPSAGSVFAGWDGGGCDVGTCTSTLSEAQQIWTTFNTFQSVRWVAFAPTNFNPNLGLFPSEASMRVDLELLLEFGFDGVITFAADGTLHEVPRLAREVGFDGVIMGLFLFNAAQRDLEIPNAIAASEFVDAYAVGNEGLVGCGDSLYTEATLLATMEELRAATGKAATTSEQIEDYLEPGTCRDFLLTNGDWLFPIVHPFNNPIRNPVDGVAFTVDRLQTLAELTEKTVCAKETGWPTGGDPAATEENQGIYFSLLAAAQICYAHFEYADGPWKTGSQWEPFWGLFTSDRAAKSFVREYRP